ncbi:hypothetical protein F4553_004162 [Allocatelliglobosispora scoriae]|uniref:Uncharacterized protein n=1 Tax=Allocatelliglobosispora scoriae TaxID=643052 RepID=A0A841BV45_9ACTN|nr:hypothetical protein [Allocatelliglobosispora scoriae]MBB5870783.1 hypothetical protein [Allocatelliglobosispora scoriae]
MRKHLPAGPYRDYATWAFSTENPRRGEFLQVNGLIQLATMNVTLLRGLVDDESWPLVERYAVTMNVYQFFETISDNISMGLGVPDLDHAANQRLELVSAFNRAMLRVLEPGEATPAVLLLSGPPKHAAGQASAFDQSLSAGKHAGIVEEYARYRAAHGHPPIDHTEIEFGLWGALVVNAEAGREVIKALDGTHTQPFFADGLRSRYRAVDRCLRGPDLPRLELAGLGAHSILVSPTLGYFASVLAELVAANPAYRSVLWDGSLGEVLSHASLLVRLQNDIGPRLLRMAPVQHSAIIHRLSNRMHERRLVEPADVLSLVIEEAEIDPAFTRLHKDLISREFNVALWHPRRSTSAASAVLALGESLGYFSDLYQRHGGALAAGLTGLDERLGDRRVSTVVSRFVKFHERLYSNRYTDRLGEYAI